MKDNKNIKELIFYSIIVVFLIIISILNNKVWKIGKDIGVKEDSVKIQKEVELLEINNITYNVPYEEQWLD